MKRWFFALLAWSILMLAGCGKSAEPQPALPAPNDAPVVETPAATAEPTETPELIDPFEGVSVDGVEVPVPTEYREFLAIETEPEAWNEHWTPLISFSHKASVDAYAKDNPGEDADGIGWVCTLMLLDRIGFEDWASGEKNGSSVFAEDGAEHYYLINRPTDVRVYAHDAAWETLNEWADALPARVIEQNGLTPYDASELFETDYTYGGSHVDLGYRFPDQPMDLAILSLSQPVIQGEGGVWCVERIHYVYSDYNFTDTQLVFPVSFGADKSAADYYAELQAQCDAGECPELLTPQGAALDYARRTAWIFGEDVSETDFERIEFVG